MVKNLPANAGDICQWRLDAQPGKIPHAAHGPQLPKPVRLEPVLCNEKPTPCNWRATPLAAAREILQAAVETQVAINKQINQQ